MITLNRGSIETISMHKLDKLSTLIFFTFIWSTAVHAAGEQGVPVIFAPMVISGPAHDSAPAFDPSGDTVYFGRSNSQQSSIVVSTRTKSGEWTAPSIAPFSGVWNDMEPAMSPDGTFLVFVSNRPSSGHELPVEGFFNGKKQKGGRLWRVDRMPNGWSEPRLLPGSVNIGTSIYAPSIASDGSIYFMTPDSGTQRFRLFRSQFRQDQYSDAVPLSFSDGSAVDVDPAVSPDESFMVFGSSRIAGRSIDLFIVFREETGTWGTPIHLGDEINTPLSDAEPRLSPDGQTLYYSSERTVDVQFPRSSRQAETDIQRMLAWDNGNYNIWQVPLPDVVKRAKSGAVEP